MAFDRLIDRRGTGSLKWDRYKGKDVLPFWVADMDFLSPEPVLEALRRRVDHGVFGYTLAPEGCVQSVVDYLRKRHRFFVEPEWIAWTPGLVPAINIACRAYGDPGDGIMTLTPVYYPFLTAPQYASQNLQAVPLELDRVNGKWEIDFDRLEASVTDETRVFILSNPLNPVGKVLNASEMERLGDFIVRHDLVLCSDEVHSDLILNDATHTCAGALGEEVVKRTLVMNSPSKTYNLAGLSCAYVVIPDEKLRQKFQLAARGLVTEVNCMGYAACEAAYRECEPWREELVVHLEQNRQLVYQTVEQEFEGIEIYPMDATYLAWLDARGLSVKNSAALFERFGVGLSEGATFHGKGFLRMNFGCPRSQLEEGLDRMKTALASI